MEKHPVMSKNIYLKIISFVVFCVLTLLGGLLSCKKTPLPIKVGFIGNLQGRYSNWGVTSRDGMLLKIEQINKAGGINGRQIDVSIKDDQEDMDLAVRAFAELVDEGVIAIIGPPLSSTSKKIAPLANDKRMLLVSTSASTDDLTGLDDFFIRAVPPNSRHGAVFGKYMFENAGWRRITATFELSNRAYTEGWSTSFTDKFHELGGTVEPVQPFTTGADDYAEVAQRLAESAPDGILVVANAIDVASICQELSKMGRHIPVATSAAAMADELLQHGGAAVEGIFQGRAFFDDGRNEKYEEFKHIYKERFGSDPTYPVVFGYDAATMLVEALTQSDDWTPEALKKTILQLKTFDGPLGTFEIDAYGDTTRPVTVVTVKDGQFIRLQ